MVDSLTVAIISITIISMIVLIMVMCAIVLSDYIILYYFRSNVLLFFVCDHVY